MATLRTRKLGFTENSITTVKPSHHRTVALNTIIDSLDHSNHTEKIEPFNVDHQDIKQMNNFSNLITLICANIHD